MIHIPMISHNGNILFRLCGFRVKQIIHIITHARGEIVFSEKYVQSTSFDKIVKRIRKFEYSERNFSPLYSEFF